MANSPFTRATLKQAVPLPPAIGTLSLRPVTVLLEPAEVGSGLLVRRTDTGQQWPVGLEHLISSTNCTAIGDQTGAVAFLEHLLAALCMAGISDVVISTDGPEIPLYDGSAAALWVAVQQAGYAASYEPWKPLVVAEPSHLAEGARAMMTLPSPDACYSYLLDHPHPLIGSQFAQFCAGAGEDFGAMIAPARTFATAEQIRATRGQEPGPEVEALCVIAYDDHLSQVQALPQPFARHKLLDLIGDLYLCGRRLQGAVFGIRTGHADNHQFLRLLLEAEQAADSRYHGVSAANRPPRRARLRR